MNNQWCVCSLVFRNKTNIGKNADEIAHLKKMIKELEEKSSEDETKVSGMNVSIENLNMNVSMQHRTVLGLVEDRK